LPLYSWQKAGDWLPIVLPISVLCIICAAVAFILIKKNIVFGAIVSVVLLIAGIVTYGSGAVIAKVNDVKSPRSFCLNIMDKIQHDKKLKMYEFYRPVYAFYTHKLIDNISGRKALLRHFKSKKQIYIVTREKEYLRLKETFPAKIYLIHRQRIDHRYVVLMPRKV
jgi:hypothetical protein